LIRPVIFLDFDGVTHPVWDKRYFHHEILDRIDRLRRKHDAQVVVSSNWKVNYPVPELESMIAEHSGVHLPLFEHTPGSIADEKTHTRGAMIHQFLEERAAVGRRVQSFVILDDLPIWQFSGLERYLIRTDGEVGFSERDFERANGYLKKAVHVL
jgi:hypothetical protein